MSMKNMAVVYGAMAMMSRLDQEEPLVLMYARLAFVAYVIFTALFYVILHIRIVSRRDISLILIPIASKTPFLSEAMAAAQPAADFEKKDPADIDTDKDSESNSESERLKEDKLKEEIMTVMEYDLRKLSAERKTFVSNACLLAATHYKTESISPLVISSLIGINHLLLDDLLFQIHLRGTPAVGPLKRPFTPPKNPVADMLKDMQAKAETQVAEGPATGNAAPVEDLHDDGEEDDEDDGPVPPSQTLRMNV